MIIDLLNLAKYVVWLYTWAVIISALLMTLTSFGVLDTRNRAVWTINDFFYRVTEPVFRPGLFSWARPTPAIPLQLPPTSFVPGLTKA